MNLIILIQNYRHDDRRFALKIHFTVYKFKVCSSCICLLSLGLSHGSGHVRVESNHEREVPRAAGGRGTSFSG